MSGQGKRSLIDIYDDAFAVADALWAAGHRLDAAWLAVATDGTTSGEILPKLEQALRSLSTSPRANATGVSDECLRLADEIRSILP